MFNCYIEHYLYAERRGLGAHQDHFELIDFAAAAAAENGVHDFVEDDLSFVFGLFITAC